MAVPFGGHPTFSQYIVWAREAGCAIMQGYTNSADGKAHSVTKIVSPDGAKWVFDVGTQHGDYLAPTTIARFDRRLGLNSPFFSIDPDTGEMSGTP